MVLDMPCLRLQLVLLVALLFAGRSTQAAEATPQLNPVNPQQLAKSLFEPGKTTASFLLREVGRLDEPSPERELLDATPNRQAIAALLKEERNKSIQPGQIPPDDKDAKGIKVRFDGVRFLQDRKNPELAWVRLVGPINEVETKTPLSIRSLLESKEPIPLQFKSVTNNTGVTVTILTDAKLKWQNGELLVGGTEGTIDFAVGTLSPARLFYSSDKDRVRLPDLIGRRVSEDDLPLRSLLEPEKL